MKYYKSIFVSKNKKLFCYYKQYGTKYFSVFSWSEEKNFKQFFIFKNQRVGLPGNANIILETDFKREIINLLFCSNEIYDQEY